VTTDDEPGPTFIVNDRRITHPVPPPPGREHDPEFAAVVDELREQYRPGVPHDQVPDDAIAAAEASATRVLRDATGRDDVSVVYRRTPEGFLEQAPTGLVANHDPIDPAEMRRIADEFRACVGEPATWTVPPPAPAAAADAALVTYAAVCNDQACRPPGELPVGMLVPFGSEADRDRWAEGHALSRQHEVSLVEQHPGAGSTITGTVAAPALIMGRAAAPRPVPPLVAFVVPTSGPPDLLCRIDPAAGASFLMTAAHACMLGRGSLGITQPHRAMYVGHLAAFELGGWEVRISGVVGALTPELGAPIGTTIGVHGPVGPDDLTDAVEAVINDEHGIPRHLYTVILVADEPLPAPPDPDAERILREQRLARRHEQRVDGAVPDLGEQPG
jgi:hypothetical protein